MVIQRTTTQPKLISSIETFKIQQQMSSSEDSTSSWQTNKNTSSVIVSNDLNFSILNKNTEILFVENAEK